MKKSLCLLPLLLSISISSFASNVHYFGQTENDIVSQISYGNNKEVGNYVKSDDANIYYEVYGNGEPILVLHGGGFGCTYEMGRFIDLLSKNYQVIAPSTRGQGKSEIGTKPITYKQKADDMMAVVNKVTDKSIIILGFSDGGYTAYKIASLNPDRVKKIISIGAGENIPATRKFIQVKLEDIAKFDKRFVDEKIALCPEPEKLQDFLNRYFDFFNSELISKELFNSIKCPVLVIGGELDANAPLDSIINAYKMIPNAQLAIIANAPHQAFIINFEAVWANIKPFLDNK